MFLHQRYVRGMERLGCGIGRKAHNAERSNERDLQQLHGSSPRRSANQTRDSRFSVEITLVFAENLALSVTA